MSNFSVLISDFCSLSNCFGFSRETLLFLSDDFMTLLWAVGTIWLWFGVSWFSFTCFTERFESVEFVDSIGFSQTVSTFSVLISDFCWLSNCFGFSRETLLFLPDSCGLIITLDFSFVSNLPWCCKVFVSITDSSNSSSLSSSPYSFINFPSSLSCSNRLKILPLYDFGILEINSTPPWSLL